ncbi:hypothetical protein SALBM135S_00962 [Streptomyces alboniger]
MSDAATSALIRLADDEGNSVAVDVLGPLSGWSESLSAEIVVTTPFVSGRVGLVLSPARLESWARALDRLDAGENVGWMARERGPSFFVRLTGERGCPEVIVEDESGSMVTVRVPLDPPDGWIDDHRQRLRRVARHWCPTLRLPSPAPGAVRDTTLRRINAFMSDFARRQAARVVELPGGFAVHDDAFRHSRANNLVVIDKAVDPDALPALAEKALGHLPHRLVLVLDDAMGTACAPPLVRAGYSHSPYLVMLHTGDVPVGGCAGPVELGVLRPALAQCWRTLLAETDADDEVIRHLVDRREARRRGADVVHFLAARTPEGEVASWADLYLDPTTGTAQIEDLITADAHLRQGYADAVLTRALRMAGDHGCATRFLIAHENDWPRHWYERRGFTVIGRTHGFERA